MVRHNHEPHLPLPLPTRKQALSSNLSHTLSSPLSLRSSALPGRQPRQAAPGSFPRPLPSLSSGSLSRTAFLSAVHTAPYLFLGPSVHSAGSSWEQVRASPISVSLEPSPASVRGCGAWMGRVNGESRTNEGRLMYLPAKNVSLITVVGEENEYCLCLYRS